MHELILNTAGKVTASDWRDFQKSFCEIWHDMPESNEVEAYQILLAKLPTFVTSWVVEEQEKNLSHTRSFWGQFQGMKQKRFVKVLRPGLAKGLVKFRREKTKHLSSNLKKKKIFKKCCV